MNVCGATRLLVPATLVGLAVATVTGSDLYGWIAAILAGVVLFAIPALRGAGGSCPVPAPPSRSDITSAGEGRVGDRTA
ncbi:MAG: hypothetical protein MUF83_17280 [Acidimicrobiales bacterium]|jgi:hypothetical protein|nr:hypothetical protein [Acidimicrobiales bacterium]